MQYKKIRGLLKTKTTLPYVDTLNDNKQMDLHLFPQWQTLGCQMVG